MNTETGAIVGQDNHRNVGKIIRSATSKIIVDHINGVFSDNRIIGGISL